MSTPVSLCLASLPAAELHEQLQAAADAGFAGLSLWQSVLDSANDITRLRQQVQQHGLFVDVLEAITGWEGDEQSYTLALDQADRLFNAACQLHCKQVAICAIGPAKTDNQQLIKRLQTLADNANAYGISLVLEFLSWGAVNSLAVAHQLLGACDRANLQLLLDVWHWQRSGADLLTLSNLPPNSVAHVQLSDAPGIAHSHVIRETMEDRRLPGSGAIVWPTLFNALKQQQPRYSVEVFNRHLLENHPHQMCQALFAATQSTLATRYGN